MLALLCRWPLAAPLRALQIPAVSRVSFKCAVEPGFWTEARVRILCQLCVTSSFDDRRLDRSPVVSIILPLASEFCCVTPLPSEAVLDPFFTGLVYAAFRSNWLLRTILGAIAKCWVNVCASSLRPAALPACQRASWSSDTHSTLSICISVRYNSPARQPRCTISP
ncbi:hypothetical protein FA95DRAFT_1078062 [Auriscalpium vulgare]|uniref:Uncharacterized protein n=1 Tax=Auriscalpium vulgare TaxID=40419 RepID=A0ACB8R512_9AGAM|nr:hypothetical protein FA95DRAFT_1078062 [Auriscalpium vulgare]